MKNPRQTFFDAIANNWDGWHDLAAQADKLGAIFRRFGIQPTETIVDVGCGTGNLALALLSVLNAEGRVIALDISPAMLERARAKTSDPRVSWQEADACHIPMPDASCDRIFCFAAWPHFENPADVLREFSRVLRDGGHVHILHFISKEEVNRIHANAHPSVRADLLAPVDEVAPLFTRAGFTVLEKTDNVSTYLLTAQKKDGA